MKTNRLMLVLFAAALGLTRLGAADAASAEFAALNRLRAARPPGTAKEMGAEKYYRWIDESRQKTSAAALAFYVAFPNDPRRWEAIMIASSNPPLFAQSFGPDVETKGTQAMVVDTAAKTAWEAKMERLKGALLAASDAPAAAREQIEWGNFARDFRATTAAKNAGQPFDYTPFHARFDAHVAKYSSLPNIPARARDYLGALESTMPGLGRKEWEYLATSSNAALKREAATQLAKFEASAERNQKPLELAFTAVDGRAVDLAKLRGKVVLVDFWATWCGPCIAELPNVKKVYAAYHDKGFEIVGISLENGRLLPTDSAAQIEKKLAAAKKILTDFTTKESMPWPQHFDGKYWNNEVSTRFDIHAIPAMFLLDQEGKIVSESARGPELEKQVKRLLKL